MNALRPENIQTGTSVVQVPLVLWEAMLLVIEVGSQGSWEGSMGGPSEMRGGL